MEVINAGALELMSSPETGLNVKIHLGEIEWFEFPGGEIQVRVVNYPQNPVIVARVSSHRDVMGIMMLNNAIRGLGGRPSLHMAYIPYARQDRVCQTGEAFSLRVFADMINSCNFSRVTVADPHSDVATALIERAVVVDQLRCLEMCEVEMSDVIISPDAGASKKAFAVANKFAVQMVQASKIRDVRTGVITSPMVYGSVFGKSCLIVDDICDGGRTFIELGRVLKDEGAGSLSLFVTHGIFSKGLGELRKYYDKITTTNSICKLESGDGFERKDIFI